MEIIFKILCGWFFVITILFSVRLCIRLIEFIRMIYFLNFDFFGSNSFFMSHQQISQRIIIMWHHKQMGVSFILSDLQKVAEDKDIKNIWDFMEATKGVDKRINKLIDDSIKLQRWAKIFYKFELDR